MLLLKIGRTIGVRVLKSKLKASFPFLLIIFLVVICIQFVYQPPAEESIIFFPINENMEYTSANTSLTLEQKKKNDMYEVNWKISSQLEASAYLRQDISFLFSNGKLKAKMNEWQQGTDTIEEEITVSGKESSLLQAVSFHYSEIHETEDDFTSAQKTTKDTLYIIDSNFSPLSSFHHPSTTMEQEWKDLLEKVTSQQITYWWEKGINRTGIDSSKYIKIPLTDLPKYEDKPLNGFTNREWKKILGNLWEGLYKNYFNGIKKEDGTIADPLGSAIPLIMVGKEKKEVLVLLITKDGDASLLKQLIR
jgi:hypothetical protein